MTHQTPSHLRGVLRALLLCGLVCLLTPAVRGDEITYDGNTVRGKFIDLRLGRFLFDTGYGRLSIPVAKVQNLVTDKPRLMFHGARGKTRGTIVGIQDGSLQVVNEEKEDVQIPIASVLDIERARPGLQGHVASLLRFWRGNASLGVTYSDQTTDELDINAGLQAERRDEGTRLVGNISYIFSQDRESGDERRVSDNELRALLKGELNMSKNTFFYSSHDFEHDEIDRISLRWVGSAGPGYRFINREDVFFQGEIGLGYYYQRNHGNNTEDYVTTVFGVEGRTQFPLGGIVEARTFYAPALNDWVDNYVIISTVALSLPLNEDFSIRVTLNNTYDNTPDADVEKNELKTILALVYNF